MPLKLPALQLMLESWFSYSFPNPAQPLHFVSSASRFVQYCLEPKTRTAEIWQKLRLPIIVLAFPVLLDVAGCDNE